MAEGSITTAELREMLRARYTGDQWAYYEEVHDSTGAGQSRSCDAIAMHLWPSKGLEIHGHELKVTRSDWLHELKDPDKAETFKRHCDRWWLVVSSKAIVQPGELPDGWGLLKVHGGKLAVSRGAAKLEPEPMGRRMLAALLRRASQGSMDQIERKRVWQEAYEKGKERGGMEAKRVREELAEIQESLAEFEKRSGVKVTNWDGPRMGDAVAVVMSLQTRYGALEGLEAARQGIMERVTQLDKGLTELREAAQAVGLVRELDPTDNLSHYFKRRQHK